MLRSCLFTGLPLLVFLLVACDDDEGGPVNGTSTTSSSQGGGGSGGTGGSGGSGGSGGTGGSGGSGLAGGSAGTVGYRTDLVGKIGLFEQVDYNRAEAFVLDGPLVPPERQIAAEGDCAVYDHVPPGDCTPPCDGFCDDSGTCHPWPEAISAGTMPVSGLAVTLSFVPSPFGYVAEPYPTEGNLFDPGAVISVTAPGDAFPPFSLTAYGVAPLVDTFSMIVLVDDVDYELSWTAGNGGARIQLALRTGWHGSPYEAMLLCETDDDGSLTIPGSVITQMAPHSGVCGGGFCHESAIARYTRAVIETSSGPVELMVGYSVSVNFSH